MVGGGDCAEWVGAEWVGAEWVVVTVQSVGGWWWLCRVGGWVVGGGDCAEWVVTVQSDHENYRQVAG